MPIDRPLFFAAVRPLFGGRLARSQVEGMEAILAAFARHLPGGDPRWLAYMLATTFHETARTMEPIREFGRGRGRPYGGYYGRGYVQLTWARNYRRAGRHVGADLVADPDLALRPDIAAAVMCAGMTEGWFRADRAGRHTLARHFGPAADDPVGARAIINGREWRERGGRRVLLAEEIADAHRTFLAGLTGEPLSGT